MTGQRVQVESVVHGGDGLARIDGAVCFIPGALPGDLLLVSEARKRRGVLRARVLEILVPGPCRAEAACPQFGPCPICPWGHFRYPDQAEWKRRIAAETLRRIARIDIDLEWRGDPGLRIGHRTRATFHADGRNAGPYRQGTHQILGDGECPNCHPSLNHALRQLREIKPRGNITVTVNPGGNDTLVWSPRPEPALRAAFPGTNGSQDSLRAAFDHDGVPIVNGTFAQASLGLNALLRHEARAMLQDAGAVLDLYCGNGNLSLHLPDPVEVLGLDHNRAAVDAANAKGRGTYRQAGETDFDQALRDPKWDAVILDPPRAGARPILPALAQSRARRILYISCDPATLARDLGRLAADDWRPRQGAVIDLFPNTPHIETAILLERA